MPFVRWAKDLARGERQSNVTRCPLRRDASSSGTVHAGRPAYRKNEGNAASYWLGSVQTSLGAKEKVLLAICRLPRDDSSAMKEDLYPLTGGQVRSDAVIVVRDGHLRRWEKGRHWDSRRFLRALHDFRQSRPSCGLSVSLRMERQTRKGYQRLSRTRERVSSGNGKGEGKGKGSDNVQKDEKNPESVGGQRLIRQRRTKRRSCRAVSDGGGGIHIVEQGRLEYVIMAG